MKYIIVVISLFLIWQTNIAIAQPIDPKALYVSLTKKEIQERVNKYAKQYAISAYQMMRTIECESGFENIQSSVIKNGIREDSWGLVQIYLPVHPEITREQALDPDFSIEWMAKNWYTTKWYGYSRAFDKCTW